MIAPNILSRRPCAMGLRTLEALLIFLLPPLSTRAAVISGAVVEVASDIVHPNGNIYDQCLLTGENATVQADPGQLVRVSFIDINDDIVQVEFAGRGRMTINLVGGAIPPAPPVKYSQPNVSYVRGLASISLTGTDATSNISAFTVGSANAVNVALFRNDVTYDGIADIALLTLAADPSNPVGTTFGGIRMRNVRFSARSGDTGISAPSVQVQDVVGIGEISALDAAIPKLWFGPQSQFGFVTAAGGDLEQPNGRPIQVHYFAGTLSPNPGIIAPPPGLHPFVSMVEGRTSHDVVLPAQPLRGSFAQPVSGP